MGREKEKGSKGERERERVGGGDRRTDVQGADSSDGRGNTERLLVSGVHYKYKLVQSSNQSHLHWPPTRIPADAQSV